MRLCFFFHGIEQTIQLRNSSRDNAQFSPPPKVPSWPAWRGLALASPPCPDRRDPADFFQKRLKLKRRLPIAQFRHRQLGRIGFGERIQNFCVSSTHNAFAALKHFSGRAGRIHVRRDEPAFIGECNPVFFWESERQIESDNNHFGRARLGGFSRAKKQYLFSGFLACGLCGSHMVIVSGQGLRGYSKYGCPTHRYRGRAPTD